MHNEGDLSRQDKFTKTHKAWSITCLKDLQSLALEVSTLINHPGSPTAIAESGKCGMRNNTEFSAPPQ